MTIIIGQEKPPLSEVIEHHGVKGMRWGIRKDEPTSSRTSSAKKETSKEEVSPEVQKQREVRAKEYEAKAAKFQKDLDVVNAKKVTYWNKSNINDQKRQLEYLRDTATKNAENARQGRMTEEQKRMIKGAAYAVGVLALAGAYYEIQSGQGRELMSRGKEFLTHNDFVWKKNSELSKDMTPTQLLNTVVKPINSDFGEIGTKMNCRRCTFAYEMRRRGYDVMATRTTNASGQTAEGVKRILSPKNGTAERAIEDRLKKFNLIGEHEIKMGPTDDFMGRAIFRSLKTQPDGARGELGVTWRGGGAHSVAWEIVKGKVVVFDCQSGEKFSDPFRLFNMNGVMIDQAGFTRLDNVASLNDTFLRRWVKNA